MSVTVPPLTVEGLLQFRTDRLQLRPQTPPQTLKAEIRHAEVVRPGLALLEYPEPVPSEGVWLLGPAEVHLLSHPPDAVSPVQRILHLKPVVLVLAQDLSLPAALLQSLAERGIAVLSSPRPVHELCHELSDALAYLLAPTQVLHGTLVDVYGVGILMTGPSGIGKSECALDLVQRGHVLVGDDLVKLRHYPRGQLLGMSAAEDPVQRRYLEIRGVGLLDLGMLFGIHATRETKRVEMHVAFVSYDEARNLDRLGLDLKYREFLGVKIPHYTLPVIPGKNLGVILEALALRYHLRQQGYFMAREFEKRLSEHLKPRNSEASHEDS